MIVKCNMCNKVFEVMVEPNEAYVQITCEECMDKEGDIMEDEYEQVRD